LRHKDNEVDLVIDIGNTVAKIAIFDGYLLVDVAYSSNQNLGVLSEITAKYQPKEGIIAAVINLSDRVLEQLTALSIPLLRLDRNTLLPIINLYKTPETLGTDRIAAVVGANGEFPDKDILVIDAGTCITYEFIDSRGNYHGGNISPGLQMRFRALHEFTAQLPLVALDGLRPLIGTDTQSAIRSGVLQGIEYEMLGYIMALKHKYPELLVFLTGGDDFSFDSNLKNIIFADKFLVLKGLNRILKYNNGRI